MSTERTLPGSLALKGGAPYADPNWDVWMNANLHKQSTLMFLRAISRTTVLPGGPTEGDIYIVKVGETNEKKVAVYDQAAWVYYDPFPRLTAYVVDEAINVVFDGTDWVEVASGGGGGSTTFAGLTDTPANFAASALKLVRVNAATDALEFVTAPGAGYATINAQTGTTYTPVLADADNTLLQLTNASAIALTIPPNAAVAFPVGTVLQWLQNGAGIVTAGPGAGVTLRARGGLLASAGQYAMVSATKIATDEWVVTGDVA